MRHVILFTLTFFLFSGIAVSQNKTSLNADTTSVLQELVNIRKLQQESIDLQQSAQRQREEDIAEWKRKAIQHKDNADDDPKSEAGMMAKIENNTRQEPMKDGWNLYGWIAFIVALFSAIIALITFRAQNKTEQHTQNAPISAQIGQFKDLTRHLYRNLVCTCAAIARFNNKQNKLPKHLETDTKRKAYPSESNFNKLKTMPDDVILDIDVNEGTYAALHELRVLLRNYNIEIDVAAKHISSSTIWAPALEQDFDNLLFKPLHLIKSAFESESLLLSTESGVRPLPDRSLLIILEEHFDKLKNNINTLGKKKCQENLKVFFKSTAASSQDATIDASLQSVFKSTIDKTGGVRRSINNLAKLGFEEFNSVFTKKLDDKYFINLNIDDLKKYVSSLDEEFAAEIKKTLKRSKWTLFWTKVVKTICFLDREKISEKIQLLEASITRMQKHMDNKPRKKLLEFIEGITSIVGSENEFQSFKSLGVINYDENDKDYVSYQDLFNSIRPYLMYISRKEWVFNDLLYVILAVDASIEVDRIGMVNYE